MMMPKYLQFEGKYNWEGKPYDFQENMKEIIREHFAGKPVLITITSNYPQRSNDQSGYFEAVVLPMIMEGLQSVGWSIRLNNQDHRKEIKDMLYRDVYGAKTTFKVNPKTGGRIPVIPSTRDLDIKEWEDFMEVCRKWALDNLGITIPLPDKYWKIGHT